MSNNESVTEKDLKLKPPSKFKVVLVNDDFTPINFVIDIIKKVFRKNKEEASILAISIHKNGKSTCGVYTHEIAETKMGTVNFLAGREGHPLTAYIEPE